MQLTKDEVVYPQSGAAPHTLMCSRCNLANGVESCTRASVDDVGLRLSIARRGQWKGGECHRRCDGRSRLCNRRGQRGGGQHRLVSNPLSNDSVKPCATASGEGGSMESELSKGLLGGGDPPPPTWVGFTP